LPVRVLKSAADAAAIRRRAARQATVRVMRRGTPAG
jgi:hypothetical protein